MDETNIITKTIIANSGQSEQGKSQVIYGVYHRLLEDYDAINIVEPKLNGACKAILQLKGKRIGIETHGAPYSRLHKSLEEFCNFPCDIILCTSRTKGKSIEAIYQAANRYDYRVFSVANYRCDYKAPQEALNERFVRNLTDLVLDLVLENI